MNGFKSDFFFKVKALNNDNVEHLYKEAEEYNYEVQERYKKILKTNKDILLNETKKKFEYLSSLKELKETYLITNFKVDPDLIKKSEEWLNKCNSFKKDLSDEYDKLNLNYE